MKRGLFKKYFLVFVSLVAVSDIIFSSVFLLISSRYFKYDRYRLLYLNAVNARNIVINSIYNNMGMFVDANYVTNAYNVLNSSVDADVFLTNGAGEIKIYQNNKFYNKKFTVDKEVMQKIFKDGIYKSKGNLNGLYKDTYYITALPVTVNENLSGAVFVATSSKGVDKILFDMAIIFLVSFVVVMIVAGGIIWLITSRMVRPLKEMVEATKVFAKGNFRNKIAIERHDEIGALSAELNKMAESLENIENNRRYFVESVSHELKTPMTVILGSIEAILDGVVAPEEEGQYLKMVYGEVKRLSNVVASMNNLTKIESGQMALEREKINISEMIRQIIFNFDKKINDKNLNIYGLDDEDVCVIGDPNLIYQVIYNLVDNAIKFANEGGYIKVRYKIANGLVYLGIKNSGQGIGDQDIKHIFERFYKADKSRSCNKDGIGLGLYIVKQILKLHDSDIEVDSKSDEYVEFFFWLPKYD